MKFSNEIKAGLVILAGIGVFILFMIKTHDFQTKPYEIKTYFTYAGDLKADAVVKLSGIEVGRVTAINFVYGEDTKVECLLSVNNNAKVRKDSIAYIATSGFVGDAYIGITPGTSPEFVKAGEAVPSEEPVQMREIMKKADNIATGLEGVVADNRQGVNNIVSNLDATTKNFEEFSNDVKKHPWKLLFKGE